MMNDDQLGEALRRSLHELVTDLNPSQALQEEVLGMGRRPARDRTQLSHRPRALAATFAAALVAVVVAIVTLGQSTVTPSFAVTLEPNHSVRVTLYELSGAAGANARLKALGVPAVIVPIRSNCTSRVALSYIGISEKPAPMIHLIPSEIPAGTTIVLAAKRIGPNHVEMGLGRVSGTPPACVKPGTGPGLTGYHHHARSTLQEVVETAQREPVVLSRYGRPAVVVISPERYGELMDAMEDAEDVRLFDESMAEGGESIPWEKVMADLGWA
jgi:antitoxin Phd